MYQTQVVEEIDTHIYVQFSPENRVIRHLRFAHCITKATDTHTEYVILIDFARQELYANAPASLLVIIHCLSRLRLLRTFLCFRTFAVTTLPVKTVLRVHINLSELFLVTYTRPKLGKLLGLDLRYKLFLHHEIPGMMTANESTQR